MSSFDVNVIHFLNHFARRSWFIDVLIAYIAENELLKGAFIKAIFWWLWFRQSQTKARDREIIICGIFAASVGLFLARAMSMVLPFRERPLRNPLLHFAVPWGVLPQALLHWSSFPSDHAVLFFALATTVWLISRRAGLLAVCHAIFIVSLPRIYTGVHHPTDVVVGALVGIAVALFFLAIKDLRAVLARYPTRWFDGSPQSFYPCFYIATFLLGTNFDPLRAIAISLWHAMHRKI